MKLPKHFFQIIYLFFCFLPWYGIGLISTNSIGFDYDSSGKNLGELLGV